MFDESTPSFSFPRFTRGSRPHPPPPPFQTNDVADGPWIRLNNHGQADTPRNRFDFAVELREYQQKQEWARSQIDRSMHGDKESQNKVARKWVIEQWQRWGIWASEWPEDGPGAQERWRNGHPACLLTMELAWEIEHIVLLQRPVDVSKICRTEAPQTPDASPLDWSWTLLTRLAADSLFSRHGEEGFPSAKIGLPSVVFRRDLKALSVNLPEPVQKLVATVENWDDLSFPPEAETERYFGDGLFGMSRRYANTLLEARAARNSGNGEGQGLFGMSLREASTLDVDGARNSGNGGGRGLFGNSHVEASTSEVGGERKSGNEEVVQTSGPEVGGERKSGNEEVVRTSGPQVEGARISGDEEAVRTSGRQVGVARDPDIAEIASSIRAMRGPRRRESRREPGRRIGRQIQGGRVKKASKQARP